ncbi:MAG: hypothetical protein RL557_390 [archaeon]|jgi:hypothetical protein
MKTENLLLLLAIVSVFVAILSAGLTYNYLSLFKNKITGLATTTGTINLSVDSVIEINFTTGNVNWSKGRVAVGSGFATLNTSVHGAGNVTSGNWTGNDKGLVVENIGNNNVTFSLSFGTDAAGLLGGNANRSYLINVTNNETGSCTAANGSVETGFLNLSAWLVANTTGTSFCPRFVYYDQSDLLRIDLALVIPYDSKTGSLNDTITATFSQAS